MACLRVGADLSEPFVILQDDCIPCVGFAEAARQVRRVKPQALLAFSLPGMIHQATRSAFYRALERRQRLLEITPHNWVPALALGWTPGLAHRALEWDATQTQLREGSTADDGRLFYFARKAEVPVWATVPCLVDHPDDVRSVGGKHGGKGRRNRRTLQLFEGDAALVDWTQCEANRRNRRSLG